MNKPACLAAARRIDAELLRVLGGGIDPERMLDSFLYRRDVLLVCDAFASDRSSPLPSLAQQYRAADAEEPASEVESDSSGFSPSRFFNSLFGGFIASDEAQSHAAKARHRHGLGRWRNGGR